MSNRHTPHDTTKAPMKGTLLDIRYVRIFLFNTGLKFKIISWDRSRDLYKYLTDRYAQQTFYGQSYAAFHIQYFEYSKSISKALQYPALDQFP